MIRQLIQQLIDEQKRLHPNKATISDLKHRLANHIIQNYPESDVAIHLTTDLSIDQYLYVIGGVHALAALEPESDDLYPFENNLTVLGIHLGKEKKKKHRFLIEATDLPLQ